MSLTAESQRIKEQIADKIARMDRGEYVDISLSNGIVRSSKEASRNYYENDDTIVYEIWHGISDYYTYFSLHGIIQVFAGTRDPWNGDLDEKYGSWQNQD